MIKIECEIKEVIEKQRRINHQENNTEKCYKERIRIDAMEKAVSDCVYLGDEGCCHPEAGESDVEKYCGMTIIGSPREAKVLVKFLEGIGVVG